MKHPGPRIQMLDGFNEGWIEFEQDQTTRRKGKIGLKEVLKGLADNLKEKAARCPPSGFPLKNVRAPEN